MERMDTLTDRLLDDTQRELARLSGMSREEMLPALLLLSLEREQVAAIAYSEDLLIHRLDALDVPDEVRELLRRVILWVQRDEELHAQYLRGLLVRTQRTVPIAFVFMRQLFGGVSGWVSAIRHHRPPARFGLRNAIAAMALWGGRLLGRIPDGLEQELRYTSFHHYCEVNIALEQSAVLSYEFLLPLLDDAAEVEAFTRLLADEVRHADVFAVLTEAFDERDRLRHGVDHAWLAERLGAISPWFLPGEMRDDPPTGRLGAGSTVHVSNGPDDPLVALDEALEATDLESIVRAAPRSVVIQGAFMLGYHHEDQSTVLHPELVDHLAVRLREWGAQEVLLLEMPNVYDRFYGNRSVAEVAEYFGFTSPNYRVVDGSIDPAHVVFDRGLVASSMCRAWYEASVRIVFARLLGDPSEVAHACMATLCNIGDRTDDRLFTNKMIDHRTAGLMALDIAPPDYALIDAWSPVADGPLGVMGSCRPSGMQRIYAGADPLSVDATLFSDLGFDDPHVAEIHRRADAWFGRSEAPVKVTGNPGPVDGYRTPAQNVWTRFVSATANPIYFHLSDNGRWFTPEFDTAAFPEIDNPSWPVRWCRRWARRTFGLHPPRR